jgi:Flp pilus assembly protein TadG
MHTQRSTISSQRGYALIYMCVVLTVLLLFTGLAVDTGRAYVVQAQLSKAVDGAALAAARNLNSGNPRGEAVTVFKANFPAGYLGTLSSTDPTTDANFFKSTVNATTGINTVTVNATATLPTTFMKLANFNTLNVNAMGEATRRMVDLSLVIDVSSSIGSSWTAVRDAARVFVNAFDQGNDRIALLTFSNGVSVLDAMPSSRGFDKPKVYADIPTTLPGGSTNMVEGLYRGWDELRYVPAGQQSGLRVIVLFTDGASNSVPGNYDAAPGLGRTIRTYDFPKVLPDPDGQTHDAPTIAGLYATNTANSPSGPNINGANGSSNVVPPNWNQQCLVAADFNDVKCSSVQKYLPLASYHANRRSPGIPTSFPFMSNSLTVNGTTQSTARPLRNKNATTNRYPTEVWNINNAARNLVEIIADAARADIGDYPIRIYVIGMGELVRYPLGTRKEMSEEILKRIANDISSPDFNETQLEGKYYYAKTAADVGPAFQALQNQIIRLSK